MTNPGHVDPGYSGLMRFTVINMGRENFDLLRGFTIVTLLFFEMSSPAKRDYGVRNAGATFGPPRSTSCPRTSWTSQIGQRELLKTKPRALTSGAT
jgi:deoxycytidine triphosphate deaminase